MKTISESDSSLKPRLYKSARSLFFASGLILSLSGVVACSSDAAESKGPRDASTTTHASSGNLTSNGGVDFQQSTPIECIDEKTRELKMLLCAPMRSFDNTGNLTSNGGVEFQQSTPIECIDEKTRELKVPLCDAIEFPIPVGPEGTPGTPTTIPAVG